MMVLAHIRYLGDCIKIHVYNGFGTHFIYVALYNILVCVMCCPRIFWKLKLFIKVMYLPVPWLQLSGRLLF